jgi:SAM-dependent methyltransferase
LLSAFEEDKRRFEAADKIEFRQLVLDVVRQRAAQGPVRILDVGGGQFPLLALAELPDNASYVICDISEKELAKAPAGYEQKICFDICGELPADLGTFDVAFSSMLAEHVPSGERLYRNLYALLNPGGVCLNHHPTLFALPFVINRLVPHRVGKRIVHLFFPQRKMNDSVFPAHYSWCTALGFRELRRRREIGFDEVDVIRQYRHRYWRPFPVIRELFGLMHGLARRLHLTFFSSFAVYYCRRAV